jgi:hypothetical protein
VSAKNAAYRQMHGQAKSAKKLQIVPKLLSTSWSQAGGEPVRIESEGGTIAADRVSDLG